MCCLSLFLLPSSLMFLLKLLTNALYCTASIILFSTATQTGHSQYYACWSVFKKENGSGRHRTTTISRVIERCCLACVERQRFQSQPLSPGPTTFFHPPFIPLYCICSFFILTFSLSMEKSRIGEKVWQLKKQLIASNRIWFLSITKTSYPCMTSSVGAEHCFILPLTTL